MTQLPTRNWQVSYTRPEMQEISTDMAKTKVLRGESLLVLGWQAWAKAIGYANGWLNLSKVANAL